MAEVTGYTAEKTQELVDGLEEKTNYKRRLELNIRDYPGLAGGGAVHTILNTASAAARDIAYTDGYDEVILGGFDRLDALRIDDSVHERDRVLFDFSGGTRLYAGVDFPSPTGMFTCDAPGTAPVAAVARGTASTTNGDFVLRSVSQPTMWDDSCQISGTGIPAGTRVLFVDAKSGVIIMNKAATATAAGVTITKGATWYGRYRNGGIKGGILDPNGKAVGAHIRSLWMENRLYDHVTALHNRKSDGTDANWAFQLCRHRDTLVLNPTVLGGQAVYEDGVHVSGKRIKVIGGEIFAGDDAIAIGEESTTEPSLMVNQEDTKDIQFIGTRAESRRAFAVKIYRYSGAGRIDDVTISDLEGHSGIMRNGGIMIVDTGVGAPGSNKMRNIKIEGNLQVGSLAWDGSSGGSSGAPTPNLGNNIGFTAMNVDILNFNVKIDAIQPASAPAPYQEFAIQDCSDVTLGERCSENTVNQGPVLLNSFLRNHGLTILGEKAGKLNRRAAKFRKTYEFGSFTPGALADGTNGWTVRKGTDADCDVSIVATNRGSVKLSTGNDATNNMGTNGVRIEGINKIWNPTDGSYIGGMSGEIFGRVYGASPNHTAFFGFTDDQAHTMPFSLAGGTLTTVPTNAFGFLYDTAASPTATGVGDLTNSSANIANGTGVWRVGEAISGTGIPANAYVASVGDGTGGNYVGRPLTLSSAATATNTGVTLSRINLRGVGVAAGVAIIPVDLGVGLAMNVEDRMSFHVERDNRVTFYVNGKRCGSAANGVGTVSMTQVAALLPRSAALRFMDVTLIDVEMQRAKGHY